jgi:hypothetical protein
MKKISNCFLIICVIILCSGSNYSNNSVQELPVLIGSWKIASITLNSVDILENTLKKHNVCYWIENYTVKKITETGFLLDDCKTESYSITMDYTISSDSIITKIYENGFSLKFKILEYSRDFETLKLQLIDKDLVDTYVVTYLKV